MKTQSIQREVIYLLAAAAFAAPALGQESRVTPEASKRNKAGDAKVSQSNAAAPAFAAPSLALSADEPASQTAPPNSPPKSAAVDLSSGFHYREISDFFNIREAYANVEAGEWEFETGVEWETRSGTRDTYGPGFSLKYGITDTFHAELEVLPIEVGDGGGHGAGDIAIILFNEFWKEQDFLPAFGAWLEGRFPTGDGSSGVDGELHFNLTKQVATNCRAHFEGFIMTANGAHGENDYDRRDFQWGMGPGFDYSFSDDTIFNINYLNRVSDEVGNHNENIVEFGVAQRVAHNQHLKFAVDVGVDGQESTPNLAAKILWSIEWK